MKTSIKLSLISLTAGVLQSVAQAAEQDIDKALELSPENLVKAIQEYCANDVMSDVELACLKDTLSQLQEEGRVTLEITNENIESTTPASHIWAW